ncbi:6-pyruvoyl trahydropterin synthase family protein [Pedobacter antarcticus]|uniref:6-carboxy-5,6,7,8-tetrahydropterin synthase n=2 Tax=Pedobacter antarcticus TaxID=34086 RepID=A0A081PLM3_9SPHI|nr:6-carboxytetrahydropterin synthase [Pedobacter antarcticus]KEQ31596.1 hypothetical protein N180_18595 [Pedobacter antarcticus 4BY]SDM56250.1 6-pyruvoyltetrahydropterin/6-carboxytetrahydropterin synthase [Pedobacter antarcticus]SFF46308.1 6-pyruvoyltetrahydropterin/6-carboxytetrahydropterin synthase [Pedobacter antarcticus]
MIIYKLFRFDSAHYLPNVPAGHPCGGMHGQTGTHTGWVIDYTAIKELVGPWVKKLDHQVINQLDGLENPTAENICLWFWRNLQPELPGLFRLELNETPDSGVIYEG